MTGTERAYASYSDRINGYAAALYRPRGFDRDPNEHPVEGEVKASAIHPDDVIDPAELGRRRAGEQAQLAALHWRARQTKHMVADPVTGEALHYIRSVTR